MLSVVVLFLRYFDFLVIKQEKQLPPKNLTNITMNGGMLHEHLRLATQQNISQPQYD